jgi:hypothetical protein
MAVINFGFSSGPRRQQIWSKNAVFYNRPSIGQVPVAPMIQSLTDTIDNMHNPVNAVMIGGQTEQKKAIGLEGLPGPMRTSIFGE